LAQKRIKKYEMQPTLFQEDAPAYRDE